MASHSEINEYLMKQLRKQIGLKHYALSKLECVLATDDCTRKHKYGKETQYEIMKEISDIERRIIDNQIKRDGEQ